MVYLFRFIVLIGTQTTQGSSTVKKNNYSIINTMVIDQFFLFVYIDHGYSGSFCDIPYFRASLLDRNLTYTNNYFEYVMGVPGY